MTHAIRIEEAGGPEVLRWQEAEIAAPGPNEAVVRHTVCGVNFIDTYHRSGLYPLPLPSGIGVEAAGVVEEVGSEVRALKPGDRVAYVSAAPGSYAEARVVPADRLVPLPDHVSDEVAASVMLKGMTVEFLIRRCFRVEQGQTVLFHAAAGGVGLLACQWLSSLGVTVIGTVSSEAKAELARANGCTHTILYTQENFVERVRALTGGAGVPVVYDSVGKSTLSGSLDCLARRGMFVSFGNASGKPDPLDLAVLGQKGSLYVTRPTLFAYVAEPAELAASARELFAALHTHAVRPHIGQRWPLSEAEHAHRALESRQTSGSSLLIP